MDCSYAEYVEDIERFEWQRRAEDTEAYIERIRLALGGDPDSDLVSLATTLKAEYDKLEERVAMDWAGFF